MSSLSAIYGALLAFGAGTGTGFYRAPQEHGRMNYVKPPSWVRYARFVPGAKPEPRYHKKARRFRTSGRTLIF